jgi:hypothetical protein
VVEIGQELLAMIVNKKKSRALKSFSKYPLIDGVNSAI